MSAASAVANAKVVQHKATSYDTTDDPQTNMPSAVLPKFSLKPKNEQSKFSKINSYIDCGHCSYSYNYIAHYYFAIMQSQYMHAYKPCMHDSKSS